jgi:hypothetical protein
VVFRRKINEVTEDIPVLIGQKCRANFAAGNGTTPPSYYPFFPPLEEFINDFTWSIPGNTFARNWANPAPHSTFTGSLVRHPNIPITVDFSPAGHSSQQEWFWKSDSSGSLYKISSIAHFVILGNHPFWNVPGAGYTIVDKPIWTKISSQSLPWSVIQLINSNGPVAFPSNHILFSSDKVYTVRFDGSVSQPAPFDILTSSGYWIYLQTIKAQNYQFDAQGNILHSAVTWADDFTIFPYTKRVMEGLDNYWPYNGITYSTIDGSHSQTDRPSWGILQLTRSISINNDFHMYVMYCPPDAGLGTEWIALSRMDWNWNLSASFPWGTGGLGVASLAGEAIFPDFPAWYSVYPNSLPPHSGGN